MKKYLLVICCVFLLPSINHAQNNALDFDGVDDYVSVPDADALDIVGDITLETWVNPSAISDDWVRLIGKGRDSDRTYGLWIVPSSLSDSGKLLW